MSADSLDRSSSHAKTVALDQERTALDRALRLKQVFDESKTQSSPALEQQRSPETAKAIEKPHGPNPELHLRPVGEIRRLVDREIDAEKMAKEDQRSRMLSEEYKKRANPIEDLGLENDRQHGR